MRTRLAILALIVAAAPLVAGDRWVRIRIGPFEVLSSAGDKPAREQMLDAEQFRWAFGQMTAVADPVSVWPIRIVVDKKAAAGVTPSLRMGRDSWISVIAPGQDVGPQWRRQCARILLNDNTGRMPAGFEQAVMSLLSTLDLKGTRLSIGAPPPTEERTKDWARLQFFLTNPEYTLRSRVLLSNLARGADYDVASKNAFEKPARELDKLVEAHMAGGKFEAAPFPGKPLAPADFTVREAESYDGRIALADVLLSDPKLAAQAEAAYKALTGPEATEGLALLAAARKDPQAQKLFEAATKAGSKNPRAWLGTGAKEGAIRAIELNGKWPDPHIRLAEFATAPNVKAAELGKAAALARRDPALWQQTALACADAKQFAEAAKAWSAAERAAPTDDERARIRQARMDNEKARADFEAAERKRVADEEARALEKLRQDSIAEVRAAEAKANKELSKNGPVPTNVQPWWDGPGGPPEKAAGALERVDCLAGGRARLAIRVAGAKTPTLLLVQDPTKIVLSGAGEMALGCGPQKPARSVVVEYSPARDAKTGTAGEVRTVEFQK